jgi:hypothetical protein
MTALDLFAILGAVQSHALASGRFDAVSGHEPKSKPGSGITAAHWVQAIRPVPRASGLATTSASIVITVRLYSNMLAEPQDGIDPAMSAALHELFTAYSGDFDLNGTVDAVDLLGMTGGVPLSATAGYLNLSGAMYRVYDITLPCLVYNAWTQAK